MLWVNWKAYTHDTSSTNQTEVLDFSDAAGDVDGDFRLALPDLILAMADRQDSGMYRVWAV